jgi:hypothetical protein
MESPTDAEALELTPLHLAPIDVNVDSLKEFRSFLARELDTNLRPAAEGIKYDHGTGVHFGIGNAGLQVQAARKRYAHALQASYENLAEYIAIAEILINAIHTVTQQYSEADLSAASRSGEPTKMLLEAVGKGIKDRDDAMKLAVDQETQRELRRVNAGTGQ